MAVAMAQDRQAEALIVDSLVKSYGAVHVLKNISIGMAPGDFLVLVGPSGCGKSTLLNCIAGLDDATSGRILIGGRDVTQVPPRDRDIAMVFQSYALYPTMSVAENIGFGMKIRRMPKAEIDARTGEVAKLLRIDHLLSRRPSQLSGGQRQRVAMGRALVRDPALFLFDEPLSNLDAKLRVEMRAEIKRVHQTTGASIVYVTHDQIEAMTLATQIAVLKDGAIQQFGTPEEIYERPANTFVADFMGSPPMNLITVTAGEGQVTLPDGQRLTLPLPKSVRAGEKLILGIRPEHFQLGEGGLRVIPHLVENAGSDVYLSFRMGEGLATARFPGRFRAPEGQPVALVPDPAHLTFFDAATGLRIG